MKILFAKVKRAAAATCGVVHLDEGLVLVLVLVLLPLEVVSI